PPAFRRTGVRQPVRGALRARPGQYPASRRRQLPQAGANRSGAGLGHKKTLEIVGFFATSAVSVNSPGTRQRNCDMEELRDLPSEPEQLFLALLHSKAEVQRLSEREQLFSSLLGSVNAALWAF